MSSENNYFICHVFLCLLVLTSLHALQDDWPTTRILSEEPDFVGSIRNVTVHLGKEAVLSCSVNNLGRYKVAWVREQDQTILSLQTKIVTHNNRIGVTFDGLKTWELRIRHIKESDKGCYMCEVNTSMLKLQRGCIDVYVPPDIINEETSGDISVLEGENVSLSCKASGRPLPRIVWKREDGRPILIRSGVKEMREVNIHNGSYLHFYNIERRQMGAYFCIASNEVPPAVSKRILLNVNFAPVIDIPNQLLGAPLGTRVRMECNVEAFPNTVNYWMKEKDKMLLNGSKYTIREERNSYKVRMTAIIHRFFTEDVGAYSCLSINSLGKAEATLRLYIIEIDTRLMPNYHFGLTGGLAEAARGHRSRKSFSSSSVCSSLPLIVYLSLLLNFYR